MDTQYRFVISGTDNGHLCIWERDPTAYRSFFDCDIMRGGFVARNSRVERINCTHDKQIPVLCTSFAPRGTLLSLLNHNLPESLAVDPLSATMTTSGFEYQGQGGQQLLAKRGSATPISSKLAKGAAPTLGGAISLSSVSSSTAASSYTSNSNTNTNTNTNANITSVSSAATMNSFASPMPFNRQRQVGSRHPSVEYLTSSDTERELGGGIHRSSLGSSADNHTSDAAISFPFENYWNAHFSAQLNVGDFGSRLVATADAVGTIRIYVRPL